MGMSRNAQLNSASDPGPSGESGPTIAFSSCNEPRRFPLAAQPEIMRAAEKDDQYASFVYDACRDAFRHLFGTRVAVAYQSEVEQIFTIYGWKDLFFFHCMMMNSDLWYYFYSFSQTKLLGQMLYYVLTTGSGQQTLGEEYCDITQVAGSHGLPPTPARRALFILYQTAVPYIAERISSRVASHGITLADSMSEEPDSNYAPGSSQIQTSVMIDLPSSSTTGASVSLLSRLRQKFSGLWLHAVRRWPVALPVARELLQLILRTNLMFFYFEGLYYHISKRAAGIRYVFIGKPSNQRPRYQILGVFLLIQLCIIAAEGLRRSNISSIASSVHQTSIDPHQSSGRRLPVLNEEGNLIPMETGRGGWLSDSTSTSEEYVDGRN